ncbi:hypothetical protein [Streptomyces sp. NPDC001985]|uniref:hypothetical protein n=1 Tax=Streptomyces sp. NPDC001985 TaxID=3154406 RepID=UPI003326BF14
MSDPRSVVRELPLITDRILLELANSVVVAQDLTVYRRGQSLTQGLLARITGGERQRELLTAQALIDGQGALITWATELSGQVRDADLALVRVADCLLETRRRFEHSEERASAQVARLADVVARVAEVCQERLVELADRLAAVEHQQALIARRQDAAESFQLSVGRWEAGQTYSRLPWPLQVVLLAQEVATGPAGVLIGDPARDTVGERLVNAILAHSAKDLPTGGFTVARLLDEACEDTPEGQLRLVAEILGSGLEPGLAAPAGPLVALTAATVELWALPGAARPARPAETAYALVSRRHGMWTPRAGSARPFVERAVGEQLAVARALRGRLAPGAPPGAAPGAGTVAAPAGLLP